MQVVVPSLDAVAEFKVQTSNYSAEFGKNSGAVMIVSIKSGTNQFPRHRVRVPAQRHLRRARHVQLRGPHRRRQSRSGVAAAESVRRHLRWSYPPQQDVLLHQLGGAARALLAGRSGDCADRGRAQRHLFAQPGGDQRSADRAAFPQQPGSAHPLRRHRCQSCWSCGRSPTSAASGTRNNFIRNPPWLVDRDNWDTRIDHSITENDKIFGRVSIGTLQEPARFGVPRTGARRPGQRPRHRRQSGAQHRFFVHAHHPPDAGQRIPLRIPAPGSGQARARPTSRLPT